MSWKTDTPIAWIDVESTGLNPYKGDRLLEVACLVTDAELNLLDEGGYESVVRYLPTQVDGMRRAANPYVRKMHDDTGLWALLDGKGAKALPKIDAELSAYLLRFAPTRTMPLGGNSVRLDFNFIEKYLPEVYGHLDYHMIDVSSVAGLAHRWYDLKAPVKDSDHTAMVDIRASIEELRYYREQVFK